MLAEHRVGRRDQVAAGREAVTGSTEWRAHAHGRLRDRRGEGGRPGRARLALAVGAAGRRPRAAAGMSDIGRAQQQRTGGNAGPLLLRFGCAAARCGYQRLPPPPP